MPVKTGGKEAIYQVQHISNKLYSIFHTFRFFLGDNICILSATLHYAAQFARYSLHHLLHSAFVTSVQTSEVQKATVEVNLDLKRLFFNRV